MINSEQSTANLRKLLIFTLAEGRYALDLDKVDNITWSVEITSLPQSPDIVIGIINVQGKIIPAINIRRRFHLPERDAELSDQLILAHTSQRTVALVVDTVLDVIETPEDRIVKADSVLPGTDYIEGVVKLKDGIVLIHDLDKFLSLEEERTLDTAMTNMKGVK